MISRRSARTSIESNIDLKPLLDLPSTKRNSITEYEPTFDIMEPREASNSNATGVQIMRTSTNPNIPSFGPPAYLWNDPSEPSSWAKDGTLKVHQKNAQPVAGRDWDLQLEAGLPLSSPKNAPGKLDNFGLIVPGVYRCGYPKQEHYGFMRDLCLKTVVTLVEKDLPDGYKMFLEKHGIRHHVIAMKGTKKEAIPMETMRNIMSLVLDKKNHPMLIHCNHGKHRTGCVVGVIRKVTGWETNLILDEYRKFAFPKERECDIEYITKFDLAKANFSTLFARRPMHNQLTTPYLYKAAVMVMVVLLFVLASGKKSETESN